MFKIKLTTRAKKELKRISKNHQLAIGEILDEIKIDPNLGKPLGKELTGKLSYKMGVYRIIYKVNKKDKLILVLTAGHRGDVYA